MDRQRDSTELDSTQFDHTQFDHTQFDHTQFDHSGEVDTNALLGRLDEALPSPPAALLGLIALLSVAHLVKAAPWAVGADPFSLLSHSSATHQARDGAVGVLVAIAGLLTVWRPRWALPCFALASAALIGQLVAGLVDASLAQSGIDELIHATSVVLTSLIGLSAVRLVALGPNRTAVRSRPHPSPSRPDLRLVPRTPATDPAGLEDPADPVRSG